MWVQRFWLRLQALFRRNRNSQPLDDEIQFHLDQQIAENNSTVVPKDALEDSSCLAKRLPTDLRWCPKF